MWLWGDWYYRPPRAVKPTFRLKVRLRRQCTLIERVLTNTIGAMKLHHWFITGIVALLTIGCATTDSQRDYFGLELLLTERQSDSTAVGLLLVVDDKTYVLDEKPVKVTLSPGQHRIDLVEDRGTPPIDSFCTSSDTSIVAAFMIVGGEFRIRSIRGPGGVLSC